MRDLENFEPVHEQDSRRRSQVPLALVILLGFVVLFAFVGSEAPAQPYRRVSFFVPPASSISGSPTFAPTFPPTLSPTLAPTATDAIPTTVWTAIGSVVAVFIGSILAGMINAGRTEPAKERRQRIQDLRKECEQECEQNLQVSFGVTQITSRMFFFRVMDLDSFKGQVTAINLRLARNKFLQDRLKDLIKQCNKWCSCDGDTGNCARELQNQQQIEFFKLILSSHMSRGMVLEKQQRQSEALKELENISTFWDQLSKQPEKHASFSHRFDDHSVTEYMPPIEVVFNEFCMGWFIHQVFVNAFYHMGMCERDLATTPLIQCDDQQIDTVPIASVEIDTVVQQLQKSLDYTFFALLIDAARKSFPVNTNSKFHSIISQSLGSTFIRIALLAEEVMEQQPDKLTSLESHFRAISVLAKETTLSALTARFQQTANPSRSRVPLLTDLASFEEEKYQLKGIEYFKQMACGWMRVAYQTNRDSYGSIVTTGSLSQALLLQNQWKESEFLCRKALLMTTEMSAKSGGKNAAKEKKVNTPTADASAMLSSSFATTKLDLQQLLAEIFLKQEAYKAALQEIQIVITTIDGSGQLYGADACFIQARAYYGIGDLDLAREALNESNRRAQFGSRERRYVRPYFNRCKDMPRLASTATTTTTSHTIIY